MRISCPSRAAIATRNPGKVVPTVKVLSYMCGIPRERVLTVDPPKDLPSQPVGSLEVFRGALRRALQAYRHVVPDGFGIGVEAGPVEFYTGTGFLETQVAVVVGPGKRYSVGMSAAFELPARYLDLMKRGRELGSIIEQRRFVGDLGESIGYIGVVTNGLVTRSDLTFQAVAMALVPWATGSLDSLGSVAELDNI